MLSEHKSLLDQRRKTDVQHDLLKAFNAHFVLSPTEAASLTSSAEPVDDSFYAALSRVKRIHTDCQTLLGSEDQTLGLELLDRSTQQLNAGFQKLSRWTQRELKTIDLENPQLSTAVRKSFRVLAERPGLFQDCLDFFGESRERTLSDAFFSALTGGDPATGNVNVPGKAIELNAHEPLRYVSDMLAWVHAATVGEKEALQNLFVSDAEEISRSLKMGRDSQPWLAEDGGTTFDGKRALSELVDRDLEGVVRQLRQRVEQTVRSHEDAVLAYQVANLSSFYRTIFRGLLGGESSVDLVLEPVAAMAMEQFRLITRDHITSLHGEAEAVPEDLSPPGFLEEALETLSKLTKSYDTSFAANVSLEERNAGFHPVLVESLDPYLAGCDNMGRRLESPDRAIFALNCLLTTRAAIRGPSYTADRVETIDEQVEQRKAELRGDVTRWLIRESGLKDAIAVLSKYTDATSSELEDARKEDVLQHEALGELAGALDAFLPSSMEDARSHIGLLHDRGLARDLCEVAADRFVEAFEGIERVLQALDNATLAAQGGHISEDEDGPLLLRDIFPRTSDEIKVLLS